MIQSRGAIPADLWFIVQRWQRYDGEQRANVLRLLSVGSFYLVHLLSYYRPFGFFELDGKPDASFHGGVTLLAVAWVSFAVAVDFCLRQQLFPEWLPFFTTCCDLLFLTAMICLGSGESSPLVLGYLLVLVLAALRVSLPLVRFATIGALVGYLFVMGWSTWSPAFGFPSIGRVPRYAQVMTLLAIAIAGIVLGQLLRGIRQMAEEFANRESERTLRDGTGMHRHDEADS